jgi:Zn finger protein HypA/HybF involved in hydrogenase expression
MKLYPWGEVIEKAKVFADQGHDVYQQFNCEHCGAKQTMDTPNVFHFYGNCEECGKQTNIRMNGHNYMLHAKI